MNTQPAPQKTTWYRVAYWPYYGALTKYFEVPATSDEDAITRAHVVVQEKAPGRGYVVSVMPTEVYEYMKANKKHIKASDFVFYHFRDEQKWNTYQWRLKNWTKEAIANLGPWNS